MDQAADLPLPTLLSQATVAFTIELDNAFEQRMPHRTTTGAARGGKGPWLTSYAMYANFLRLVDDAGTPLSALKGAAAITNLKGLIRWRYITLADGIVRPTAWGVQAKGVWRPLAAEVEAHWAERLGDELVAELNAALKAIAGALPAELPAYLPVAHRKSRAPRDVGHDAPDGLLTRLARATLAFTLEYERDSTLSLPVSANVLRLLGAAPLPVRDLPRRSGVSKEAIAWSLGVLSRCGLAAIEPNAGGRGRGARLTDKGLAAQRDHRQRIARVEERWRERCGGRHIDALRAVLIRVNPRLAEGTIPPPSGWRFGLARPLPHQPMVLHRGGFPDGA